MSQIKMATFFFSSDKEKHLKKFKEELIGKPVEVKSDVPMLGGCSGTIIGVDYSEDSHGITAITKFGVCKNEMYAMDTKYIGDDEV